MHPRRVKTNLQMGTNLRNYSQLDEEILEQTCSVISQTVYIIELTTKGGIGVTSSVSVKTHE